MKQISTFFFSILAIAVQGQDFTTGNLVVSRVGDGATTLSTGTAPVAILEFNKTTADQASPVKTVSMGSTTQGSRLTLAGTTAYEGQLNLSANGQYLSLLGYDVPVNEVATNTGITSIAVSTGGTGYTFSSVITISGGGGTGATAVINSLSGGAITGIRITNSGTGYTSTPTVTITTGSGFTAGTINRVAYWQGISSKKVIARLDKTGAVNLSTNFSNSAFAAGPVKNAVTTNGLKYWINTGRMEFVNFGQTTEATQIVANAGPRSIGIFNNQLYYLLGFNNTGLNFTNPPLPEAPPVTTTALPLSLTTNESPMGFVFFDLDNAINYNGTGYDLLYIAEITGGLEKYYFDGTTWLPLNSKYTPVGTPLNNALFPTAAVSAITGEVNLSGEPVIYAVSGNATSVNNKIFAITDASGRTGTMVLNTNTTSVTLATAGANYSFKGIAFTPSILVLPVQFTAFTGSLVNSKTLLQWTTAAELNIKVYELEKSTNGSNFSYIGTVTAKNNSRANSYVFEDANPVKGANYYRIKTIGNDGGFTYTKVVVINSNKEESVGLSIFPNPVVNSIIISHSKADVNSVLKIVSAKGELIAQYNVAQNATQTSIDASVLTPGQYFINFISNGKSVSRAFVK